MIHVRAPSGTGHLALCEQPMSRRDSISCDPDEVDCPKCVAALSLDADTGEIYACILPGIHRGPIETSANYCQDGPWYDVFARPRDIAWLVFLGDRLLASVANEQQAKNVVAAISSPSSAPGS